MPIPPKTPSRLFRTGPAKAALAVGGAAVAAGALLAFPATAVAASNPANLIIRPSRPFPSFSVPAPPSTQFPTSGGSTFVPVGVKKSPAPKHSVQDQFSYVSTFSPAPVAASTPANTASAACVASSVPVPGPGGDLDLPGINGTSKDPGHTGALPIKSLGPNAMLPPQIDSTNLGQLKVTRPVDATSTNLSMVASSGYRFPCVHIEVGLRQGFVSAQYALVNAGLVADDRSGSTETLTWTYSTILWSYTLPGSTAVHQGSGQINAQPDRTATSLVTDSKAVAAGTIGLTLVVSLGLITLYFVGRRRNRARYRERYYRRAAARAQREARAAGAVSVMQPAAAAVEPVEPNEIWEPGVAAGAAEAVESGETTEGVEVEAVENAEGVKGAEEVDAVEAPEAAEVEVPEAEMSDGPDQSEETTEVDAPTAAEEPVESDPEEHPESEQVVQSSETAEPEEVVQSGETGEPEETTVQSDETTEPEEVAQSSETAQAEASVQSDEKVHLEKPEQQSDEPASESEAEPAPGGKHEPAAAR